ncbi:MAG TPA: hypothetical protein VL403_07035 [Candidatus Kryptonia bacterium]|nr:hypothetical protein [Candidatus Kryptonia bacterium]
MEASSSFGDRLFDTISDFDVGEAPFEEMSRVEITRRLLLSFEPVVERLPAACDRERHDHLVSIIARAATSDAQQPNDVSWTGFL